jgi:hypothetical protein
VFGIIETVMHTAGISNLPQSSKRPVRGNNSCEELSPDSDGERALTQFLDEESKYSARGRLRSVSIFVSTRTWA